MDMSKHLQFLVEHGADPTAQDKYGWTLLDSASKTGHVEIDKFLVEQWRLEEGWDGFPALSFGNWAVTGVHKGRATEGKICLTAKRNQRI